MAQGASEEAAAVTAIADLQSVLDEADEMIASKLEAGNEFDAEATKFEGFRKTLYGR